MAEFNQYISSFSVDGLWGKRHIHWDSIFPGVNILVGINGSLKTTLLNLMYQHYSGDKKSRRKMDCTIKCQPESLPNDVKVLFIDSIDVPARNKKVNASALMQELNYVVFQNQEGTSFFNYRMRILDMPEEAKRVEKRIKEFYSVVNELFKETGKTIALDKNGNMGFMDQQGQFVTLEQLSAGEKQMLLVLLKVFLLDEKPAVVFMDEPELALHIRWQRQLIDKLVELNPKAQYILTTHSPSMFSQGWGSQAVYMNELTK